MATTPTYPGVYIEEDASPSISVSNAPTAVPVFIGRFALTSGAALTPSQCIRVSNWLDFSSNYSFYPDVSVAITSTAPSTPVPAPTPTPTPAKGEQADKTGDLDAAYTYTANVTASSNAFFDVQAYFLNGGGPCYILPLIDTSSTAELNAIASAIQKETDITLLAQVTGAPTLDTYIGTLLASGAGYFNIAYSSDGKTVPATQADQTAVYYPALQTNYRLSRPADNKIAVTGYLDASGDTVKNMEDLKKIDPDTYASVSSSVDSKLAENFSLMPNSTIAGVYCATDSVRGVWKAPANVVLSGFSSPTASMTDDLNGQINDSGINVIRTFSNRGIVVWGARTLAGATSNSDTSWRYIPVRRLFNSAERDIKKSMQTMVFESNNQPTWEKVRAAIENYLYSLWSQGALAGATSKDAYFVQIGEGVTMSADDIAQGKMIAAVGMAAVRPAEFIILQFTQNMSL
jgi:hypothetical protein